MIWRSDSYKNCDGQVIFQFSYVLGSSHAFLLEGHPVRNLDGLCLDGHPGHIVPCLSTLVVGHHSWADRAFITSSGGDVTCESLEDVTWSRHS